MVSKFDFLNILLSRGNCDISCHDNSLTIVKYDDYIQESISIEINDEIYIVLKQILIAYKRGK
jgi:hypothetical protein